MIDFKNKNVLVTGGTGLIGQQLIRLLIKEGAFVKVASLDDASLCPNGVVFDRTDLTEFSNCMRVCKNMDIVFNLVGLKVSPKVAAENPATCLVPFLMFNTNMMEAARRCNVDWFLYTSSMAVYQNTDFYKEDTVWNTFPSPNDKFGGWGKRMGELQAEAYAIQYSWNRVSIVRPGNVYGPFDNFDAKHSMVIPSLIKRANEENPLVIWGDGSAIRDFVHARDVARAMMFVVQNEITQPVNSASGKGTRIKELVDIIVSNLKEKPVVTYDTSKPTGDPIRVLDMSRLQSYGYTNSVSLEDGIKETMEWYLQNKYKWNERYNAFN